MCRVDDEVDYSNILHYADQNVISDSECDDHYKFMSDKKYAYQLMVVSLFAVKILEDHYYENIKLTVVYG